jgi:NAD(P)-dependent dehydrogenase (short-subunit alcohol dehydrogenase family)
MKDYLAIPDLLKDRVILVTGAGAGIGRVAARRFAAAGATVVLLGRTTRKLEQIYDEIEQDNSPQPAIFPLNLEGATPKDYDDLARILETEFGRVDGLLHNAAILQGLTPVANYNPEIWYRVMQVNLNGPFLLTQALLGLLNKAEDASLVFTTDRHCAAGRAYWGAYAAAKGALQTLMRTLADELETNTSIRVNCIDPGPVRTDLRLLAYPAGDRSQWADPETIMNTYLYLMGPDSKDVSGRILKAQ